MTYLSLIVWLSLTVSAYGSVLHIIAGETNYQIGGTVTTIVNGKIMISDTTIIASHITIIGTKGADGEVTWKSAEATGNLVVILKDATVTAKKMVYNLKTNSGTLSGNASMTVVSSSSKITINSSTLTFDTKKDLYTGNGSPVIIVKGKTHIEGLEFTYDAKQKIFNVFKNVYLFNSSNGEKAWSKSLTMDLNKNTIVLKNVKMEINVK